MSATLRSLPRRPASWAADGASNGNDPAAAATPSAPTASMANADARPATAVPRPARHRGQGARRTARLHAQTVHVAADLQTSMPARPSPATRPQTQALRRAWAGVRRLATQAVRQRINTEMADLAGRIRRLHDVDPR